MWAEERIPNVVLLHSGLGPKREGAEVQHVGGGREVGAGRWVGKVGRWGSWDLC